MYEVNYNGRMSYVSNCFYCHIRPERELLAIAKFLVLYHALYYLFMLLFVKTSYSGLWSQ